MDIKLITQPDGITCGPTALAMVVEFLRRKAGSKLWLDILSIGAMIGTNAQTGTTHENMMIGLKSFGLNYTRSTGDTDAVNKIKQTVLEGDIAVLRTLTHGVPHWIITHAFENDRFVVEDPWLGHLNLTAKEIADRISPRDWEFYRVPTNQTGLDLKISSIIPDMKNIREQDKEIVFKALSLTTRTFEPVLGNHENWIAQYTFHATDWNLSRVLLVNNNPAGFYLLNADISEKVSALSQISNFSFNGQGVEGVALLVEPEFRNCGYGRLLRDIPNQLGFEYVLGQQRKELGNLDNWLKHRVLIAEDNTTWITGARLNGRSKDQDLNFDQENLHSNI